MCQRHGGIRLGSKPVPFPRRKPKRVEVGQLWMVKGDIVERVVSVNDYHEVTFDDGRATGEQVMLAAHEWLYLGNDQERCGATWKSASAGGVECRCELFKGHAGGHVDGYGRSMVMVMPEPEAPLKSIHDNIVRFSFDGLFEKDTDGHAIPKYAPGQSHYEKPQKVEVGQRWKCRGDQNILMVDRVYADRAWFRGHGVKLYALLHYDAWEYYGTQEDEMAKVERVDECKVEPKPDCVVPWQRWIHKGEGTVERVADVRHGDYGSNSAQTAVFVGGREVSVVELMQSYDWQYLGVWARCDHCADSSLPERHLGQVYCSSRGHDVPVDDWCHDFELKFPVDMLAGARFSLSDDRYDHQKQLYAQLQDEHERLQAHVRGVVAQNAWVGKKYAEAYGQSQELRAENQKLNDKVRELHAENEKIVSRCNAVEEERQAVRKILQKALEDESPTTTMVELAENLAVDVDSEWERAQAAETRAEELETQLQKALELRNRAVEDLNRERLENRAQIVQMHKEKQDSLEVAVRLALGTRCQAHCNTNDEGVYQCGLMHGHCGPHHDQNGLGSWRNDKDPSGEHQVFLPKTEPEKSFRQSDCQLGKWPPCSSCTYFHDDHGNHCVLHPTKDDWPPRDGHCDSWTNRVEGKLRPCSQCMKLQEKLDRVLEAVK